MLKVLRYEKFRGCQIILIRHWVNKYFLGNNIHNTEGDVLEDH
uniref:Uncharacterized protein n=1 Tax=Lepeophtheirus salmonis TaxID=72036 RepID=A0A0K2U288_LEPSM